MSKTTTLQTEAEYNAAITDARAKYHAIVDTGNRHAVAAASAVVTELQAQREAFLATGAAVCKTCNNAPLGMLKTPAIYGANEQLKAGAVYAVACRVCQVYETAGSPRAAVERWNAKRA
jgi:hypothetical protein